MRVRIVTEEEVVLLEHAIKSNGHEQVYSMSIASETKEGRCQLQIIDLKECLLCVGEFAYQQDFFLQSMEDAACLQLLLRWPHEIGDNYALLADKPHLLHQIRNRAGIVKEITLTCNQGAGKLMLLSFKKELDGMTGPDTMLSRFFNEWRLSSSSALVLQQLLYYPVKPLYLRQYVQVKCEELYLMLLHEKDATTERTTLPAIIIEKLKSLHELIAGNPDKNYHIEELARHIMINRDHLKRYFKTYYGHTIHQYILLIKMEAAQQSLLNSDQTCKEIAFDLGFKSDAHFSEAFKKHFGISPGQLRKKNSTKV